MGQKAEECWEETWHIIYPNIKDVKESQDSVLFEDRLVPIYRNGTIENVYWTYSYSPVLNSTGQTDGVLVICTETTEKVEAMDALKESERKFRLMVDNIPNLAWMADADGYIFWYNKKWYEYTGTTLEQMQGWGWKSVHDPVYLESVLDKWTASIKSGQPFEMIFPLKGADGVFRHFLTRVVPFKNENGEVEKWFGTNTDVTAQREAELAIKESEARFRTMAESTDILITVTDEHSETSYFNKAWTKLTGKKETELTNGQWLELMHPEDKATYLDRYNNTAENKEAFHGEFRIKNKDGAYRWLLTHAAPRLKEDMSFTGYISSFVDITERRVAEKSAIIREQNLRNIILQSPVAMCLLKGPEYVVELANERMIQFWGKESEAIINTPLFEALPEVRGQGFEEILKGVYTTGESFSAQDVHASLIRDGVREDVYVTFVYEAYREAGGDISGLVGVAVETTDQVLARKKIEEVVAQRTAELEEANRNLQKSNSELAQFAYIASHDLQEPLRKISTFTNLLDKKLKGKLDNSTKTYFDKVQNSAIRMSALIKDILTYSELTTSAQHFRKVDLNNIVQDVITDYELIIQESNATIKYNNLPVVSAIPIQMLQLFSNLISNSLKFINKDTKPVINITVQEVGDSKTELAGLNQELKYVKVVFEDNGIGIEEQYQEKIFNIFQRLHSKTEYDGTGIGLALCKKIMLNHGGEMNATGSREGKAIFNMIFPIS